MPRENKPTTIEPIPEQYAKDQWKPVAYTNGEGADWIPVGSELPKNWSSLRYENGWIYDKVLRQMNVSPWRHIED